MFNSTCTSTNTSTTTSNDVLLPSQLIRLLSLPRPVTRPAVVRPCTVPPPLVYAHLCCLRDRLLAQQERHRRLRHEDIDTAPTLELPNATTTSASTTSTSTSTSTSSLKTVSLDGDDAWEGLLLPYATKLHPIQRCVHLPDINADARRFNSARHLDLTVFLQALFHDVAEAIGCTLSICDLQHTHMFLTAHSDDGFEERGELGLLFHAREYPAWDDQTFPFYLGFCQNGSNLYLNRDDATAMRLRSAVWLLGCNVVVVLDADGAERWPFGTVYESELGKPVADIFFFDGGKTQWPLHRINQGLHVVRYA